MEMFKKLDSNKIKKLPSFLLSSFILIIVLLSLIISANKMMEFIALTTETEALQTIHDNKLREIDELKYYINAEIDAKYKERMARLLGYCYPDEVIYYIE